MTKMSTTRYMKRSKYVFTKYEFIPFTKCVKAFSFSIFDISDYVHHVTVFRWSFWKNIIFERKWFKRSKSQVLDSRLGWSWWPEPKRMVETWHRHGTFTCCFWNQEHAFSASQIGIQYLRTFRLHAIKSSKKCAWNKSKIVLANIPAFMISLW